MPPSTYVSLSMHMFIAILSHPGRRNHSGTAQLEPVSLSHGKPFISALPTRLQELSGDVPRTIFAYLSDSGALSSGGHTCVCRNWCDLIDATNTLWSTTIVDGLFYVSFCTR